MKKCDQVTRFSYGWGCGCSRRRGQFFDRVPFGSTIKDISLPNLYYIWLFLPPYTGVGPVTVGWVRNYT